MVTHCCSGHCCVSFGCHHGISLPHIVQRHPHPHNWQLQGVRRCECESEWQFASFIWTAGTDCCTAMAQSTDDLNWMGGKTLTVGSVTVCMAVLHINSRPGMSASAEGDPICACHQISSDPHLWQRSLSNLAAHLRNCGCHFDLHE